MLATRANNKGITPFFLLFFCAPVFSDDTAIHAEQTGARPQLESHWEAQVITGTVLAQSLRKALSDFLHSRRGQNFIWKNQNAILNQGAPSSQDIVEKFGQEFQGWMKENGITPQVKAGIKDILDSLPAKNDLTMTVYFSRDTLSSGLGNIIDHLACQLADPIAWKIWPRKLGHNIVANAICRAANHSAYLAKVQSAYDGERNKIRRQIMQLASSLPQKLINEAIAESGLPIKMKIRLAAWEDTPNFKQDRTLPKRSYYHLEHTGPQGKKQSWTGYLDVLDKVDFKALINEATKKH